MVNLSLKHLLAWPCNLSRDLTEPKKTSDAVTKKYVDDLIADNVGNINGGGGSPFFKENGNYQTTHAITMAFKKLLNLSEPSEPFEAATKEYYHFS